MNKTRKNKRFIYYICKDTRNKLNRKKNTLRGGRNKTRKHRRRN